MINDSSILIKNMPKNWDAKKIKYVFEERKEINNPVKTDILISLTHDKGVIPHNEKGNVGNKAKEDLSKYKIVYPGDIVVNSMNVIIGSSGLSDYFGLLSPVYYILYKIDKNNNNKFFHYLFRSYIFQKSLIGVGNGILEHRMRVPIDKLGSHLIPLPPYEEQELISRYLDKKVNNSNLLIEKIQKKIALLKEQRNKLINHYVTKGINPNVEMKDSGVEWIGEIPKHWDCKKLKFVSKHISEKRLPHHGDIKISPENVEAESGKILNFYSEYDTEGQIFSSGDILFNKLRVYLNKVVLCDFSGLSMGEMIVIRPEEIFGPFLYRVLNSVGFIDSVNSLSNGVKVPRPPVDGIFNTLIPFPPASEQIEIFNQLDARLKKIESLIDKLNNQIKLVTEYRQSLISSVVTGKVRLTEEMI